MLSAMPTQPETLNRSSLSKEFRKHGTYPTLWGRNVALSRESQKLTKTDLAERSSLDLAEVLRVESGERPPSDAVKCALAHGLGLPLEALFPMPSLETIADHAEAATAAA